MFIPRLNIATTLESSFKGHNKAIQDYQKFRDMFGRDDKIVLLIQSEDIFSPHFLARMKQFHQDLEDTLPLLSEVKSLINAPYIEGKNGQLLVHDFFDRLPETMREAHLYREKAKAYHLYKNTYISKNADFMILLIKTQAVSALTEDGMRIKNHGRGILESKVPEGKRQKSISQVENMAILGIVETAIKQYSTDNFRIVFSGIPVYQYHVEPKIRSNMVTMSIMVLGLTFLFMMLLFRRVSGIFLPQFVVILGLTATLGIMAIAKVPFTLTSSMLPSILLSVGLTAPIHFMVVFFKYQRRVGRIRAIIRTLTHSGLPIVTTSLTTIIGLLSFVFTDIAPVAHLGILGAIGIAFCLIFTLVFLPALIAVLQILPGEEREKLFEASIYNRVLIRMGLTGVRHAHDMYIVSLVAFIVILPGLVQFNFSHNMLHFFDEESPFIKQTQLIEHETSGFRALEILIDTKKENGIFDHQFINSLEQLESYALEQNSISGRPYTGKVLSIAHIIKRINQAWHDEDPESHTIPQDDFMIESQLTELQKANREYLAEFSDSDLSMARFTVMMYWEDAAMDVDFVKKITSHADELFKGKAETLVTGVISISSRVIDSMMSSLAIGYCSAFFIIAFFMIISVGEVKLGFLAMIPNVFPIIAGLGLMGHLDIPLNTYNLVGGSIVIGVAVDDTIHFFHHFKEYYNKLGDVEAAVVETLNTAGRALITTSLILVSCFWLRLFSPLKVISDFGLVMGFSLLVAFLADVVMAPALLSLYYDGRGKKAE